MHHQEGDDGGSHKLDHRDGAKGHIQKVGGQSRGVGHAVLRNQIDG